MAKKILYKKHLWRTNDGGYTSDKNDLNFNNFVYDVGFHNGPGCILCGLSFCEHCQPEEYDSECPVGCYRCSNCGGVVNKSANYCVYCGKKFEPLEETK